MHKGSLLCLSVVIASLCYAPNLIINRHVADITKPKYYSINYVVLYHKIHNLHHQVPSLSREHFELLLMETVPHAWWCGKNIANNKEGKFECCKYEILTKTSDRSLEANQPSDYVVKVLINIQNVKSSQENKWNTPISCHHEDEEPSGG